jgi:6-pyruvoyltetrahydropterin/6-carboxytetrahydropterin synthase
MSPKCAEFASTIEESSVFQITKDHNFSAAHQLPNLPDDHPCSRLHGHNYVVRMVLEGPDDAVLGGPHHWVRDYGELAGVRNFLSQEWDHRNLNEWFVQNGYGQLATTAEMLAYVLFSRFHTELPELVEVRVSETPKTWASYRQG